MSDDDLKPCPFCGGEAKRGENHIQRFNDVYCANDECKASSSCEADTIEEAVSMWNTRPLEKQIRIQAMQECLQLANANVLASVAYGDEYAVGQTDAAIELTKSINQLIEKEKARRKKIKHIYQNLVLL